MSNPIKNKVRTELQHVKAAGQLRAERIREIVRSAVSQVASEVKNGTQEVRSSVVDTITAVTEVLAEQSTPDEIHNDVTASIEGAIEGMSQSRHPSLAESKANMKRSQEQLNAEQEALQQDIHKVMTELKTVGQDTPSINTIIQSALQNINESREVDGLKRRYAQMQAQAAIIKANLAERYGRTEEIQEYLDEAREWYTQTRLKVENASDQLESQRLRLEDKMGEAGKAAARKEARIRHLLRELMHMATQALQDKAESSPVPLSNSSKSLTGLSKED
jgi:uncharacterized protein (UPF0335 family)